MIKNNNKYKVFMNHNQYYLSPLSQRYTTSAKLPHNQYKSNNKEQIKNKIERQKVVRYVDGLLVPQNKNTGIFFGFFSQENQKKSSIATKTMLILYNQTTQHKSQAKASMKPDGKNYLLGSNGIRISAEYKRGEINSIIGYHQGSFIVWQSFRKGVKQGRQYYYSIDEKLLTISKYHKGNLQLIEDSQVGQFSELIVDTYVKRQVEKLIQYQLDLPKQIQPTNIDDAKYVGSLAQPKNKLIPHGYGFLMVQQEIYMGNFNQGLLSGLGYIKFTGNSSYYGDLSNGVSRGYGCFQQNSKTTYKFNNQNIDKEEFIQYIRQNTVPDINQCWLTAYSSLTEFYQYLSLLLCSNLDTTQPINKSEVDEHMLSINDSNQASSNIIKDLSNHNQSVHSFDILSSEIKSLSLADKKPKIMRKNSDKNEKNDPIVIAIKSPKMHKSTGKKKVIMNTERQQIICQELGIDKDYVMDQQQTLKPYRLHPKLGFAEQRKIINLDKNSSKMRLNLAQVLQQNSQSAEQSGLFEEFYRK